MYNKSRKLLLVNTAASLMVIAVNASAQKVTDSPPRTPMSAPMLEDRFGTIQRLGLSDPALKLTTAQRAEIEKTIHAYLVEQNIQAAKSLTTSSAPQTQETLAARDAARDKLAVAVGQVLNEQQRRTWQAAQAARQAKMDAAKLGSVSQGNR